MSRRRLAIEQARQRRAEAAAEAGGAGVGGPAIDESLLDLAAISDQTRQLIKAGVVLAGLVGMWVIWNGVLPALTYLKDMPIIGPSPSAAYQVEGTSPNNGGGSIVNVTTNLTWGQLLFAAVALAATFVASRNLPGLLELTLLKNLPFDAGARYAWTTLIRYTITLVGLIIAASQVGITWDKVQWLVAAMGLGLGFGLQEIFANFISGLVILFERPIRVGDIVTIGETSGIVSRVRIRATTITDWDRKELVVPNKDLVTGRLLNWTLSDLTNRVVIPVGIAYGSDTERARQILLEIAANHPFVLREPAPMATFEGFGDSALNLVLRCYLPNLENRLATIHDLYTAIHQAYHEAAIEISFPQRDIHIRSIRGTLPTAVHIEANGNHDGLHAAGRNS
jgi:potassium efflux system protein